MTVRQFDAEHRIRQELDDRAFYFNCVFPRHVRISGSSWVIKTVCSKCAEGIPSAVQTVQPSSSKRTAARAGINHRLDRQRHPRLQSRSAPALAVVRHLRFFVQFAADTVADEFAHDREIRRARLRPRCSRKHRRAARPRASISNRAPQRALRHAQQSLRPLVDHSDRNRVAVSPTQPSWTTPISSFTMSPY